MQCDEHVDPGLGARRVGGSGGDIRSAVYRNFGCTAATVNFVAPDAESCPVDLATSARPTDASGTIPAFTRVSNTANSAGPRNVSLKGLSSQTTYYFRVECSTRQPGGVFKTH